MNENNHTPAEQTLCHRLVTLIATNVGRVVRETNTQPDESRHKASQDLIASLTLQFVEKLRDEPAGVPVERQDYWLGMATCVVLRDVWGIEFPEMTPEERRRRFELVN